jgi:hypothetical protein
MMRKRWMKTMLAAYALSMVLGLWALVELIARTI